MLQEKLAEALQKIAGESEVKLYEIDATSLGGSYFRFTNTFDRNIPITSITQAANTVTVTTTNNHALVTGDAIEIFDCDLTHLVGSYSVTAISENVFTFISETSTTGTATRFTVYRSDNGCLFDGNLYVPVPIEVEGFEKSGQGSLPTPTLRISNATKVLMPEIISFDDLTGATFKRIRTFRKFLDDGSDPDPTCTMPYDVYVVNRKTAQNKNIVEYELASPFDQEALKLPRRLVIKNTCTHTYRVFNAETGTFDYTKATCPYAGSTYFDEIDIPTGLAINDRCGKRLASCKARFGNDPLPTRAFPGIKQV